MRARCLSPVSHWWKRVKQNKALSHSNDWKWRNTGNDAKTDLVGDSLAFCCACVAAADGHVEPIEESRFSMLLGSIGTRGVISLERDKVMEAFRAYCGRLTAHDLRSPAFGEFFADQFDNLRVLIGRRDLALMVLRCCEAVASADSLVRPVELDIIRRMIEE